MALHVCVVVLEWLYMYDVQHTYGHSCIQSKHEQNALYRVTPNILINYMDCCRELLDFLMFYVKENIYMWM